MSLDLALDPGMNFTCGECCVKGKKMYEKDSTELSKLIS